MAETEVADWGKPLPEEVAPVSELIDEPLTPEVITAQALVKIAEILQEILDEMRKK